MIKNGLDERGHRNPSRNKMEYGYGKAYWLTKANGLLIKKDGSKEIITRNEIQLRDGIGNIKQKNINTGFIEYDYDSLYQLTEYQNAASGDITYDYDYRGNRESMVNAGATITYGLSNNNKTTSIIASATKSISYDDRGNMTLKGGYGLGWDYKNRLTGTSLGGGSINYKYNNSDRKIYRESGPFNARKGIYYYYNGDKLLCEKDNTGKTQKIYTNDNTGVLGMSRYIYDDSGSFKYIQKLYYLFDDLGSVTAITASTGLPLKYYLYDPFGNVVNTTKDDINMFTFVGRYGGQKDWESGLIQFQHRWYDSEIGKWISRDPIGMKGGINTYEYVGNNSVNYNDPSGLITAKCFQKFLNCANSKVAGFLGRRVWGMMEDVATRFAFCVVGAGGSCLVTGPGWLHCTVVSSAACNVTITVLGGIEYFLDANVLANDLYGCYGVYTACESSQKSGGY